MNLTDPQILHMVFILPGLLGLSLFYDAIDRRRKEEQLWWLSLISGSLVIITGFVLYLIVQRLYQF